MVLRVGTCRRAGGVMKGKCGHCNHVYSITHDPNDIEGYFINMINAEKLGSITEPSLLDISDHSEYTHQCPKCKKLTII